MDAPKIDDALVEALTEASRETFRALRAAHPDHRFYAFGLYVTRDVLFVGPTAASDEGLRAKAAQRGIDPQRLRWSLADSPHHLFEEERFEPVQQVLAARPDPYELEADEFEREVKLRTESCFAALARLDQEGLFGTGDERHALVVSIFGADESDRLRLEHAERLNPPEALERIVPDMTIREPTGDPLQLGSLKTYQAGGLDFHGGLLVAACTDGELIGWRVGEGEPEELFALRDEDEHWSVVVDDGGGILYGSTGGVRRRSLDRLDEPTVLLDHDAKVTQLVRSPDGSQIVADESYEQLVALDARGNVLWERRPGGRPLAYAPDGSTIAAAGRAPGCVSLLDPADGEDRAIVACTGATSAAFAPDGGTLAVANRSGIQIHAKAEGWEATHQWPLDARANALAFSPSGERLAGAFDDGSLRVWDVSTETLLLDVHGRQEELLAVAWIDDERLAAGGRDVDRGHPVYLWRLK